MAWAPDYCTSVELKDYIGIEDNDDDALIALWLTTVSRNVDSYCGRQFGQTGTVENREYETKWDRTLGAYIADLDDVQDVTNMVVEVADVAVVAATSTTAGYRMWPRNAVQKGQPYERITVPSAGLLTVSAKWGWSAVPAAVKVGVFLQGKRLAKRKDSPFGISGSPQEQGEIRLLAQLDSDFRTSLRPLVRKWWAA